MNVSYSGLYEQCFEKQRKYKSLVLLAIHLRIFGTLYVNRSLISLSKINNIIDLEYLHASLEKDRP